MSSDLYHQAYREGWKDAERAAAMQASDRTYREAWEDAERAARATSARAWLWDDGHEWHLSDEAPARAEWSQPLHVPEAVTLLHTLREQDLRVLIKRTLNGPTECQVYSDGRLIFDGLDRSASL